MEKTNEFVGNQGDEGYVQFAVETHQRERSIQVWG